MIDLKNIIVDFDGFKAVDNVNLKVEKNDIYGIVGFSGAGKSTLVRTINLLQRPTSGEVLINGENILDLPKKELRARRKNIGMIFQHFNLLNNITVLDNVIYPIRKLKIPKEEKVKKAKDLLQVVGIGDKADNYPRELSGGQQQRCAIARALASDPEILLCDEATSALDPKTTKQILKLLKDLNAKLGLTIVIITHQMEVVKDLCNKCAVMQAGKIIEAGPTIEIFAKPKEPLTREFVETSTNVAETIEEVKQNIGILKDNELLVKLNYIGASTTEPLINDLYDKFGVKTNVLAGNIEFITGIPVGNLIVSLSGDRENLGKIGDYLEERNVDVEVLGGKDGIF
ncbi:MAG: methionine ABC transporter ATP-binding protein [Anaerococcus sp.]|uniref:methionine ABC transporter ATP-binding protein n=1 Tax=Anaerococcus TaxID=165779 RepID=UPI001AE8D4D6|nr:MULTISPECIES: methionine ABC transporter ATP-binding protein [Anaerococcus]MBP2070488.1 D-methionine transport system ATP-binding protein [Anaerococcus nagyae]MDU1828471.1 methionine ABC transporter ATP-binding protein [Anaerococcus sp.]MDU1865103.1 methionine ABC transporter ATP-binding protein [Anaerococcus sp.]MDU2353783.1 methionine ABC transporter ATP-binding protein [Anaerococcus sp.]MDU2566451.1 methionine ABC transporter ATP-binding protein [Anaerococcus sp.]